MLKFELDLQGIYSMNIAWFGKDQTKKELEGNDYLMLYGALSIICSHNKELLEDYGLTMEDIMEGAAIEGDELYLNGFEGYDLSDRLNFRSLYLNKYGCVIASIEDKKFDRFLDFVM